jgi:hypothetical protein
MELEMTEEAEAVANNAKAPSLLRQTVRYSLHLLAVYAIVHVTGLWLAGFVHGRLLPILQHHPPRVSSFEFVFSHLFIFSFFPALFAGYVHAEWYRQRVALFVWLLPVAILGFKFARFSDHGL